jgi:adenylate cyclase
MAVCATICLAAFAVLWTARRQGMLEYLELKTYDALLRQESRDYSFSSRFLIVGINDSDIEHFGQFPVSDSTLKAMLQKLQESNPRAIGVDVVRDFPVPDWKEWKSATHLHEGWETELSKYLTEDRNSNISWAILPKAADAFVHAPQGVGDDQVGAVETVQDDTDLCVRRALLFLGIQQNGAVKTFPSLAYQLAVNYLAAEPTPIGAEPVPGRPDLLRFGPQTIEKFRPTDGSYIDADASGYQFLLDYRGPRDFPRVSVQDVLEGRVKKAAIENKIVLVGVTAMTVKDIIATPVDDKLFGVYFNAISAEQLLRFALGGAHPISSWTDSAENGWMLLWALLGGLAGFRIRTPLRWTITCTAGIALLILIAHLEMNRGIWIPLLPPAILWLVCAALVTSYLSSREKQDRLTLMKLFSSQVSGAVAQEIWTNRSELLSEGKLVPRELCLSILFTDLQGFTSLSQTMSPAVLMAWLNEYMGAMSRIVEKHGGIVNKYMGDAVMAIFGAPVQCSPELAARQAVACALEMRAVFGELKLGWKMRGLPDLKMRIGIQTGPLVVGTLGGTERAEYTVIGDTVNTAQRLEAHDKKLMDPDISADGCRIIIGDATRQLLNGQFRLRALGEVQLTGRSETLAIHGVIQ